MEPKRLLPTLAARCGLFSALLLVPIQVLGGALSPFGSLAQVVGSGFSDADFHVASLQPSTAQITFNAGSAADSHAEASAAVNALSASATSFNAPYLLSAQAQFEDTLTISAPAGTTVVPIGVGLNFFSNLQVLAGGLVGGYGYASKSAQLSITGLGTGFFDTLSGFNCLSSVEPGANFNDPCIGFDPSAYTTAKTMFIPVGSIDVDALLRAEVGAAPGCVYDTDGVCHLVGSFAEASDPFFVSLTPLIAGVSIVSASGQSYASVAPTVPEPATLALLGIGLAGLGFSRRMQ